MKIYCTGCEKDVEARLTNGAERYPHRPDLATLPFWKCDTCQAYVSCAHKTSQPTRPLGVLASPELVILRKEIHAILDPLWQSGKMRRGQVYSFMSHRLGYNFHTGATRSVEEAEMALTVAELLNEQINPEGNWL